MLVRRLRATPLLSGKTLSTSRSESVAVQKLVSGKGMTGGATMAAGLSVYARSAGLLVEKCDGVKGTWGEAPDCGTVCIREYQYEEKTIRK